MPYTTLKPDYFNELLNCEFARVRDARRLFRRLMAVDYSVIESRRQGHQFLNEYLDDVTYGAEIFTTDTRFPAEVTDEFLTTCDINISGIYVELATTLSYRETNFSKDVRQPTNSRGETLLTDSQPEQGRQDANKKFIEVLKHFGAILTDRDSKWTRTTFEARTASTWADTPVGPGNDGED